MNTQTALPLHPSLLHPATGQPLRAIYVSEKTGRVYWPILGGSGPAGGEGGDSGDSGGDAAGGEFEPITSQDALDAILERRLNRERARYADYDDLAEKARQHDALAYELSSETEKQTLQASEDGYNAAMAVAIPRIVEAEFRAAAKGVLTPDQLATFLEGRDLAFYTFEDGEPDVTRIEEAVMRFAPEPSTRFQDGRRLTTLGQGQRPPSKISARDKGKAEAAKRFGDKDAEKATATA